MPNSKQFSVFCSTFFVTHTRTGFSMGSRRNLPTQSTKKNLVKYLYRNIYIHTLCVYDTLQYISFFRVCKFKLFSATIFCAISFFSDYYFRGSYLPTCKSSCIAKF